MILGRLSPDSAIDSSRRDRFAMAGPNGGADLPAPRSPAPFSCRRRSVFLILQVQAVEIGRVQRRPVWTRVEPGMRSIGKFLRLKRITSRAHWSWLRHIPGSFCREGGLLGRADTMMWFTRNAAPGLFHVKRGPIRRPDFDWDVTDSARFRVPT